MPAHSFIALEPVEAAAAENSGFTSASQHGDKNAPVTAPAPQRHRGANDDVYIAVVHKASAPAPPLLQHRTLYYLS